MNDKKEQPESSPFADIEKKEVKDEKTGKIYWQYACRMCKSVLLTQDVDVLGFVWNYEQQKAKNAETAK